MKILIAGYGKFGHIAVSRLSQENWVSEIVVLDIETGDGSLDNNLQVSFLETDVVQYICALSYIHFDTFIIPTVPFHLAAACLLRLYGAYNLCVLHDDMVNTLPNIYRVDRYNVCCSYADFLCPDDCPESESCSVTGEIRTPMYNKLSNLEQEGSPVVVIRSQQLLPGIGGFYFGDLMETIHKTSELNSFVMATSCRCHAILTGITKRS